MGLSKGGVVLNKKAIIRPGELIRSKTSKEHENNDFNISVLDTKTAKMIRFEIKVRFRPFNKTANH